MMLWNKCMAKITRVRVVGPAERDRTDVLGCSRLSMPLGALTVRGLHRLQRHEIAVLAASRRHHGMIGDRRRVMLSSQPR